MDESQARNFYNSINKHLSFLNDVSLVANGEDTIALINQTINKYCNSEFIGKCVEVINSISKNDYEFCKNLFEISCALVKYRRDPYGHEIVMTPQLLIKVGEGDCKKFTTWICSVLKRKKILSADKVVNYDPDEGWQHIYAIAYLPDRSGPLILDPVNNEQFDKEVRYRIGRVNFYDGTKSKLLMPKLSLMGNIPNENQTFLGIGEASDSILGDLEEISGQSKVRRMHEIEQAYICGMGAMICGDDDMSGLDDIGKTQKKQSTQHRQAQKAQRQEKRKKIVKNAKKAGFTPVRAAFLVLIAAGGALAKHTPIKFNLAVKLAELWKKDNGVTVKRIWNQFGGKDESLKKAIIKASNIQISGIGEPASAAAIVGAVTISAPLLAVFIKTLSSNGLLSKQDASKAANLVEDIEHANTTANGDLKPEVMQQIKANLPSVQEAIKIDDGGDKAVQQQLKQTSTPNDVQTTVTPPTQNQQPFTNTSSSDQSAQSSSSDQSASSDADSTATNAAGFSLSNWHSWLTGAGLSQLGLNLYFPGHETATMLLSSGMVLISIYLFISKLKPIKS